MRHVESLRQLVNIIASHTPETLARETQTTAITLRSNASSELRITLEQLAIARLFMQSHAAVPENWKTSLDCFSTLADFFYNNTTLEDAENKAVCCWYLLFDQAIPSDFPFEEIIVLGKAYLADPYQFAAFICWLLDKGVRPYTIEQKKLLYLYFQQNCADFSELTHTYHLIKNFSEDKSYFLQYAMTIPCLTAGYQNYTVDGKLQSYNVMGIFFEHVRRFDILNNAENDFTVIPGAFETHSLILLRIFGFEFIKLLIKNPAEQELAISILSPLLHSDFKNSILLVFPQKALSGELSYDEINTLLIAIGRAYLDRHLAMHPLLIAAVADNAFYIHTPFAVDALPLQSVKNAIKALTQNKDIQTNAHLPFLIALSKRLRLKNFIWKRDFNQDHGLVIDFIFDYLLSIGSMLNEHDENILSTIKDVLMLRCEKTLTNYEANIDHAISAFFLEKMNYDEMKCIWSAQLSNVNMMCRLFPELTETNDGYPYSSYALSSIVIKRYFDFCMRKNSLPTLSVQQAQLAKINDDPTIQFRQLQEAVATSKDLMFIKHIIMFVINTFDEISILRFFHAPFGNDCYLFDSIVTHNDVVFRAWAFSTIPSNDDIVFNTAVRSYEQITSIQDYILQSSTLTEAVALNIIQYRLNKDNGNSYRWHFLEDQLELIPITLFSRSFIDGVFALQPLPDGIIAFLNDKHTTYLRETRHSVTNAGLWRRPEDRKREHEDDETTDDEPDDKAPRTEPFQNFREECERLLNL